MGEYAQDYRWENAEIRDGRICTRLEMGEYAEIRDGRICARSEMGEYAQD